MFKKNRQQNGGRVEYDMVDWSTPLSPIQFKVNGVVYVINR